MLTRNYHCSELPIIIRITVTFIITNPTIWNSKLIRNCDLKHLELPMQALGLEMGLRLSGGSGNFDREPLGANIYG